LSKARNQGSAEGRFLFLSKAKNQGSAEGRFLFLSKARNQGSAEGRFLFSTLTSFSSNDKKQKSTLKGEQGMKGKLLKVNKIKNGIVIDHVRAGEALKVCQILGILPRTKEMVTVAMNVFSRKMGRKDIIKIENKKLNSSEIHKIAIISPEATINIIEDFGVKQKEQVKLPKEIIGIIKCPNPTCVSNANEPIQSKFLKEKDGKAFKCHYCGYQIIDSEELMKSII